MENPSNPCAIVTSSQFHQRKSPRWSSAFVKETAYCLGCDRACSRHSPLVTAAGAGLKGERDRDSCARELGLGQPNTPESPAEPSQPPKANHFHVRERVKVLHVFTRSRSYFSLCLDDLSARFFLSSPLSAVTCPSSRYSQHPISRAPSSFVAVPDSTQSFSPRQCGTLSPISSPECQIP